MYMPWIVRWLIHAERWAADRDDGSGLPAVTPQLLLLPPPRLTPSECPPGFRLTWQLVSDQGLGMLG